MHEGQSKAFIFKHENMHGHMNLTKKIELLEFTLEYQNPNVWISVSAESQMKWSPIPTRSDFGHSVC